MLALVFKKVIAGHLSDFCKWRASAKGLSSCSLQNSPLEWQDCDRRKACPFAQGSYYSIYGAGILRFLWTIWHLGYNLHTTWWLRMLLMFAWKNVANQALIQWETFTIPYHDSLWPNSLFVRLCIFRLFLVAWQILCCFSLWKSIAEEPCLWALARDYYQHCRFIFNRVELKFLKKWCTEAFETFSCHAKGIHQIAKFEVQARSKFANRKYARLINVIGRIRMISLWDDQTNLPRFLMRSVSWE